MKKYWIIPLIIAVLFMGCSSNQESTPAEDAEGLDKSAVFATFLEQEDLDSFVLNTKGENIFRVGTDEESKTTNESMLEFTKEPLVYHGVWDNEGTPEDVYRIGEITYYQEEDGSWTSENIEERIKECEEDEDCLSPKGGLLISDATILKPLEDYYELTEEGDTYVATLDAKPEDLGDIQAIILGPENAKNFPSDITLLKARFTFAKDTGYPVSFAWELTLEDRDFDDVSVMTQEGHYDKVNQLEAIPLPEEIQELQ